MLLFYKHFYNILFYCLNTKSRSRWLTYEFFILEKPFRSLFSSGSIFMIDFFFFLGFSPLITFFKDRVLFTSRLLDKINSYKRIIHIFVFIIPHNHTVYAREPMNVGKGDSGEEAACPQVEGGVGLAQGFTPRDLVSCEGHQASILTPVSSS